MGEAEKVPKVVHHQIHEGTEAEMIATGPDGIDWHISFGGIKRVGEKLIARASAVDHFALKHVADVEVELPNEIDTIDNELTIVAEPDERGEPSSRHIVSKALFAGMGLGAGVLTGVAAFRYRQRKL